MHSITSLNFNVFNSHDSEFSKPTGQLPSDLKEASWLLLTESVRWHDLRQWLIRLLHRSAPLIVEIFLYKRKTSVLREELSGLGFHQILAVLILWYCDPSWRISRVFVHQIWDPTFFNLRDLGVKMRLRLVLDSAFRFDVNNKCSWFPQFTLHSHFTSHEFDERFADA